MNSDIKAEKAKTITGNIFQTPELMARRPQDVVSETTIQTKTPSVKVTTSNKKSEKSSGAFRTIGEVAEELDVQQHVLRFWETKFSYIRPLKRGGGRRYYRPEDVELLRSIYKLLYTEGYTIKGVQKLLREKGKGEVIAAARPQEQAQPDMLVPLSSPQDALSDGQRQVLRNMLKDLKDLRSMIGGEE